MNSSFGTILTMAFWVFTPLYSVAVGLAASSLAENPTVKTRKEVSHGALGSSGWLSQLLLCLSAAFALSLFRGVEGPFAQGQLSLTLPALSLHSLAELILVVSLPLASVIYNQAGAVTSPTGLGLWGLGPLLGWTWLLLPFVTHVTTALLVLELVGVGLVWAISSSNQTPDEGVSANGGSGASYALVLFIWVSGVSALALLVALAFGALDGAILGAASAPGQLGGAPGLSETLMAIVVSLKFLIGSGQFLLFSWYRFLPPSGLIFYLLFYYPMHLILGANVFLGLLLPGATLALGVTLASLGVSLLGILPHLGSQNSPALTLAGSSFVGLSFLMLGLFNLG